MFVAAIGHAVMDMPPGCFAALYGAQGITCCRNFPVVSTAASTTRQRRGCQQGTCQDKCRQTASCFFHAHRLSPSQKFVYLVYITHSRKKQSRFIKRSLRSLRSPPAPIFPRPAQSPVSGSQSPPAGDCRRTPRPGSRAGPPGTPPAAGRCGTRPPRPHPPPSAGAGI